MVTLDDVGYVLLDSTQNVRDVLKQIREERKIKEKKYQDTYKSRRKTKIAEQDAYLDTIRAKYKINIIKTDHKAQMREYNKIHKERINEAARNYYKTPKGKAASLAHQHKRRSKHSNKYAFMLVKLINLGEIYICGTCGRVMDGNRLADSDSTPTVGHIIPLMKGGMHYHTNIIGQCWECNRKQHSNTFYELYPVTTTLEYQEQISMIIH